MLDKGKDAQFYDGGSRWGIKGSNEVSEGLSAVYNFEHKISTADAGQPGGRLAYVGLSGGFGTLTAGQIWSASYNHAGVIRDIANWHSASDTSVRVGNALSYSFVGDAFSVQFDAIMDGKKDSGKAIDQWELGATVNIGDIGKVAFAHVKKEDAKTGNKMVRVTKWTDKSVSNNPRWRYSPMLWTAPSGSLFLTNKGEGKVMRIPVQSLTVYVKKDGTNYDKDNERIKHTTNKSVASDADFGVMKLETSGTAAAENKFTKQNDAFVYGTIDTCKKALAPNPTTKPTAAVTDALCAETTGYKATLKKNEIDEETFYFAPEHVEDEMDYGEKSSHVSASFDVGAVTLGLGHSTTKSMDPMKTKKAKTNYIGASGGIGDTGLSWNAWYRTKEAYDADSGMMEKTKPWTIGLKKTLGGGAWAYVEHGNNGKKGKEKGGNTVVGLGVNF